MNNDKFFRSKPGYNMFQRVLVIISIVLLAISLILEYFAFKNITDIRFYVTILCFILIFLNLITRTESVYNRSDAFVGIFINTATLFAGIYFFYKVNSLVLGLMVIASILNYIAFVPHTKKIKS